MFFIQLFEDMGVLTREETKARQDTMLEQYIGLVEVEAQTMIDMIVQHIIPSMKKAAVAKELLGKIEGDVSTLRAALADIHHTEDLAAKAQKARVLRLETMISLRVNCDEAEAVCPADLWTLATYKELLFLDCYA